jgi:hypothetical protein
MMTRDTNTYSRKTKKSKYKKNKEINGKYSNKHVRIIQQFVSSSSSNRTKTDKSCSPHIYSKS